MIKEKGTNIRYVKPFLITTLFVIVSVLLLNYFQVKEHIETKTGVELSPFFSWELAIIIHTIVSFISFLLSKNLEYDENGDAFEILTVRQMGIATAFIWGSILLCIGIHIYYLIKFPHGEGHTFFGSLLFDSITSGPLFAFFISNLIFFIRYLNNEIKRKYFGKLIIFLDLPFLISYIVVAYYSYMFQSKVDYNAFLIGASATILLCSNLVTLAFNAYEIKFRVKKT